MKSRVNINSVLTYILVLIIVLGTVFIVGAWIVSAVFPEFQIRSVLGNDGIRWLLGHFTENVCAPLLVWIVLLAFSYGCMERSGLLSDLSKAFFDRGNTKFGFRSRIGVVIVAVELFVVIIIMSLLTVVPHAVLLSVDGTLFPSSFSDSLVPVLSFTLLLCSTTYGITTNHFRTVRSWGESLAYGLSRCSMFVAVYFAAAELYAIIRFVIG